MPFLHSNCAVAASVCHNMTDRLKNLKYLTICACPDETVAQPGRKGDKPASLTETRGDQSPRTLIHLEIIRPNGDELFSCLANYPAAHVIVRGRKANDQPISFSLFQRYLREHNNVIKSVTLGEDLYSADRKQ